MTTREDLRTVSDMLTNSDDPVAVMMELVRQSGGLWPTHSDRTGIFEVQLLWIIGIGTNATGALTDWLDQARDVLSVDTAA